MNAIGDRRTSIERVDRLLAVTLALFAVAYLSRSPLGLWEIDEAHYLHEAKRVLGGAILYRDIFELTTPAWVYLMAGLFWLFGTTLATARAAAAVIHGLTVGLIFLAGRRAGARPGLAAAAGVGYLVLCQPAFPVASQHWLSSFLAISSLLLCLAPRGSMPGALLIGVIGGLGIAAHQARGVTMGCAAAVAVFVTAWISESRDHRLAWHLALRRVGALIAGTLLVVTPMVVALVMSAGIDNVWRALVIHPLFNYRATFRAPWGHIRPLQRLLTRTIPAVLEYSAIVPALSVVRLLFARGDAQQTRVALVLLLFCVGAIASIWHFPGYAHVAFITPVFLVTAAELMEWGVRRAPKALQNGVAALVSLALLAASGGRLYANLQSHTGPLVRYDSAFGPVDVAPHWREFFDELNRLLADVPGRVLYSHPFSAYNYLVLDARNPTRFEFLIPGRYSPPEHSDEVLAVLRRGDIPYVTINRVFVNPSDPVAAFLYAHYQPIAQASGLPEIWRRNSTPAEVETGVSSARARAPNRE